MMNAGRVVSKQQILEYVWQYDFGGESTVVETYISYLRKKLDGSRTADDPHPAAASVTYSAARPRIVRESAISTGADRAGIVGDRAGRVRCRDRVVAAVVSSSAVSTRASKRPARSPLVSFALGAPHRACHQVIRARSAQPPARDVADVQAARVSPDGRVVRTLQGPFTSTSDAFSRPAARSAVTGRGKARPSDSTVTSSSGRYRAIAEPIAGTP